MLQILNRVVHQDFDKEDHVNKKITLAVAATAVFGLLAVARSISDSGNQN